MSSKSKQQVPFLPAFSSQNNLLFLHPDVSTQIGFCSVLWNIFFFPAPHLHAPLKNLHLQWLNDLVTQFPIPRGSTLRRYDWHFSVAAQPCLSCAAASLPFGFQCMTEQWSLSRAHHSVCTEGLCCGTDKTLNPLGRGLELGGAAFHPKSEKVIFFQRKNGVKAFLTG